MCRKWDIQWCKNFWLSLGFHFDHTDPSLTLHLPLMIISFGRLKQPGFIKQIKRRKGDMMVAKVEIDGRQVKAGIDDVVLRAIGLLIEACERCKIDLNECNIVLSVEKKVRLHKLGAPGDEHIPTLKDVQNKLDELKNREI